MAWTRWWSRRGPDPIDEVARGPAGEERRPHDAASRGLHDVPAHDGLARPVGALDEDVGKEGLDERERRVVVVEHDAVHHFEGRERFRPLHLRYHRPAFAL